MSDLFDQMFGGQFRQQQAQKGLDVKVQLQISFSEAYQGTSKSFNINGHNITMNFKPGLKTGQKFRVRGKGQPHPYNSNLPNGDVIINIHVMADARFILQGDDIWVETTLPWYDIMLGSKALVQTPDGPVSITVPQGTKPASTLRIKDKGFPIYNTGKRGSLLCRVNASYPELNQTQVEHLNQIRNAK
jgi:curved DNA-binding protein